MPAITKTRKPARHPAMACGVNTVLSPSFNPDFDASSNRVAKLHLREDEANRNHAP